MMRDTIFEKERIDAHSSGDSYRLLFAAVPWENHNLTIQKWRM
ncbi:MAG: hypothetical protein WCE94_09635 [Candidatus Methanoperedens sp.]